MSQRFPLLLAVLSTRHVEAEKQPGTAAGLNVATEDQHLRDFLLNCDSATRGQGPGRELSQNPLLFTVQYCSQNHSAPAGQPSVEARWRVITPPLRGTQQGSEEPQWGPCLAVSCDGADRPPAPVARHLGLAGQQRG